MHDPACTLVTEAHQCDRHEEHDGAKVEDQDRLRLYKPGTPPHDGKPKNSDSRLRLRGSGSFTMA